MAAPAAAYSRRDWLTAAALFGAVFFLFLASYRTFFWGGQTYEFCHYAEIARNILHGRGFSTAIFSPTELAYLDQAGVRVGETGPVVTRFPLHAYWSALWMSVAGEGDLGMALGNGIAHGLWVAIIFLAGKPIFGTRTALIASALWGAAPTMLAGFDLSGHPDVFFGALFTLLNMLLWQEGGAGRHLSLRRAFGLGLLAGVCCLARHSFVIWLPFCLGLLWLRARPSWRPAAAFLLGYASLVLPWTVFYFSQTGQAASPLFLYNLAMNSVVRGHDLPWLEYRTYAISDFLDWRVAGLLAKKAFTLFNIHILDLPTLWRMPVVIPFAVLGFIAASGAAAGLAGWLLLLLGWETVVFSFLRIDGASLSLTNGRYFLWFAPFVLLYAADLWTRRLEAKAWRWGGWVVCALLVQFWAATYLSRPRAPEHQTGRPIGQWPELVYLREQTDQATRIATNIPAQAAWYAGRWSVNVPNRPEDLRRLEQGHPIDGLLFIDHRIGEASNLPEWVAVFQGRDGLSPDLFFANLGFKLERSFPGAVFLRRTPDVRGR